MLVLAKCMPASVLLLCITLAVVGGEPTVLVERRFLSVISRGDLEAVIVLVRGEPTLSTSVMATAPDNDYTKYVCYDLCAYVFAFLLVSQCNMNYIDTYSLA